MWRLVSLGQRVGEGQEKVMSPSPGGDKSHLHQDSNSRSTGGSGSGGGGGGGGLTNIFKGLAGAAKLSKSPAISLQSSASISAQIARLSSSPTAAQGLPQHYAEAFEQLKNGSLGDRVAAAHALRHVVADYPLNPV